MDKICALLLLLISQIDSKANFTECLLDCTDVNPCEKSCPNDFFVHTSLSAINATSCENITFIDVEGDITTIANSNKSLPTESDTERSKTTFIINSGNSTTSVPPINTTESMNKLPVFFICVKNCPDGYYTNKDNQSCLSCGEFCGNCSNIKQIYLNGCVCNTTELLCSTDSNDMSSYTAIIILTTLGVALLMLSLGIILVCRRIKKPPEQISSSSDELIIPRIYEEFQVPSRYPFSGFYSEFPELNESADDNHDSRQKEVPIPPSSGFYSENPENNENLDGYHDSRQKEVPIHVHHSSSSFEDIRQMPIAGNDNMKSTANESAYKDLPSEINEHVDQSKTVNQCDYLEYFVTVDLFCDNIHLLCFIDNRLYRTGSVLFGSKTKEPASTMNGDTWFKSETKQSKTTLERQRNIEVDKRSSTLDLFYIWDEESDNIKLRSEYVIMTLFLKNRHQVDFEESFLVAVGNELCCLCRWLLTNYTYDEDLLEKMLSKAYKIGNYDIIKILAWTATRKFYNEYKTIVTQIANDIYPAYRCKCKRSTEDQECLRMSNKLIVIELNQNAVIDIPNIYMNFDVVCFTCDDETQPTNIQHETGEIMKTIRDIYGTNSYNLRRLEIDGDISSLLFSQHSKLSLICPSKMKSSNYGINHVIVDTQCIQLYCERKGIIPLGEKHFPKNIKGIPTDVLQGRGQFAATTLRVGDKIGTANTCGTLGGFYLYAGNFECLLTCAHVLYSLPTLLAPPDHMCHEQRVDVFLDPAQNKQQCGVVIRRIFKHDDPYATSIDAALVHIKSPAFIIDSNDIVLDINGSHTTNFLGLSSPFVNQNYCDHLVLCCEGSSVLTVAAGAVTKNIQDVTFHRQTEKDVYFHDLGPVNGHANGVNFPSLFIAQPAHMQIPVGSLTEKRIFTMYNQIVMNIPLRQGDSGTCIYITGNTTQNTGCVGMAIAFCSGSGLSLVTPIHEIIRAVNRL